MEDSVQECCERERGTRNGNKPLRGYKRILGFCQRALSVLEESSSSVNALLAAFKASTSRQVECEAILSHSLVGGGHSTSHHAEFEGRARIQVIAALAYVGRAKTTIFLNSFVKALRDRRLQEVGCVIWYPINFSESQRKPQLIPSNKTTINPAPCRVPWAFRPGRLL